MSEAGENRIRAVESGMLRRAIMQTFMPDPYTRSPEPELVEAVALAVELMAEVSAKRGQRLASNPWKGKPAVRHLEHAVIHVDTAHHSEVEGDLLSALDRDTGLPHIGHGLLRLAFAYARIRGVGGPEGESIR